MGMFKFPPIAREVTLKEKFVVFGEDAEKWNPHTLLLGI